MADRAKIPGTPAASELVDRAASVFDIVPVWLFSEPLSELLALFGEQMPSGEDPLATDADRTWLHLDEELPDWVDGVLGNQQAAVPSLLSDRLGVLRRALLIERVAARHFDFRSRADGSYRERFEIADGGFDASTRSRVDDLARRLGLVESEPTRHRSYEHTLVLGGGYRSPLLRTRLAAQIRGDGVQLGQIDMLGSPRPLLVPEDSETAPEHQITDEYAPGAADEFDLMIGAARSVFGARPGSVEFLCGCSSSADICPQWSHDDPDDVRRTPPPFTHERRVELFDDQGRIGVVLSASTGRPPYRPDTADTFRLWARLAKPHPGQRVLAVGTQIFMPFQTFDGLRRLYLPHGCDFEYFGLGPEWTDRPLTAENLLQETLSGIRSARRLLVAAAEVLTRS